MKYISELWPLLAVAGVSLGAIAFLILKWRPSPPGATGNDFSEPEERKRKRGKGQNDELRKIINSLEGKVDELTSKLRAVERRINELVEKGKKTEAVASGGVVAPVGGAIERLQQQIDRLGERANQREEDVLDLNSQCVKIRHDIDKLKKGRGPQVLETVQEPPSGVVSVPASSVEHGMPASAWAPQPAKTSFTPTSLPLQPPPRPRVTGSSIDARLGEDFDRADEATNRNFDRIQAHFQREFGADLERVEETDRVVLFHFEDGIRVVPYRNTRLAERWHACFDVSGAYNLPIRKVHSPALIHLLDDGSPRVLRKGSLTND
jgi:prefoldin subunit 5